MNPLPTTPARKLVMTLDLFFVQGHSARAILAQLAADLGVTAHLVAERVTTMEIFPVSVWTVRLDADAAALDAAHAWFGRRGIHRLAPAA